MRELSPSIEFRSVEEATLKFWEEEQIFECSLQQRRHAKEFAFYDGPPFANGLPHYGHLLANTVKDTVPRYWTMRGYYVERRFGWDCHGLPVETEIEKRKKLRGRPDILAMGIANFNEECRASVLFYAGEWQKTITRLGRWVDWNRQYRTMDRDFMESVWWVLKQLDNKGLFYRGHKIVAYSPRLSAVLSNFEANQNYKDVQDPAITVKFKVRGTDEYLLAWTTTPWTLISNLALAVGPKISYVRVQFDGDPATYILAEALLEKVLPSKGKEARPYHVVGRVLGSELAGVKYEPLFPYFSNHNPGFFVVADDYVSTDDGTGIVHMAPAYGEDDFRICRDQGIELVDPLDEEACFTKLIPEFQGQFVKDADKDIIRKLKDSGKLFRHETIVHSYPHCERTEGPLIYRAVPAWYVRVESIKDRLVANNKTIRWVPEHLRDGRMGNWLENARDWAISRNRFWGTPLPVWVCSSDESHREVLGSVAELEEKSGAKVPDLHKHFIDDLIWRCAECAGTMRRIPEVFDCWFESGSMPYAQLHYPFENKERLEGSFPADFIAEGLDQTRGWFYTLSILSAALFDRPAFKNVVVNGLVLAKDGKKMSKRLGNYTPPIDLLNTYGADSVRLYMLNSPILRAEPLKFSDEGVRETTRAVILPYWNAVSFLTTYAVADGWKPTADLAKGRAPKVQNEMDRWIISRLQSLIARVHTQMEQYRLYSVVPEVLSFIDELTNWYIRLSRRRFWGTDQSHEGTAASEQNQAYETLFYVCVEFSKIFAPFAPFVTEHVYRSLTGDLGDVAKSIHLCDAPESNAQCIDVELEERMALVRRVTELGRSLRAKHQLKTRQVLPGMLVITRKESDRLVIERSAALIKEELNLKMVDFSTNEGQFVNLSIKPNLRSLGPKLGKNLGMIQKEFQSLNASPSAVAQRLDQLTADGSIHILEHELREEDLLIERAPKDERLIATDAGLTVLLDTQLNDALILEGLAREVVNRIQNLRKDSGLKVSDRVHLKLFAQSRLLDAIQAERVYISEETLATKLEVSASQGDATACEHHAVFELDEYSLTVGLRIAK